MAHTFRVSIKFDGHTGRKTLTTDIQITGATPEARTNKLRNRIRTDYPSSTGYTVVSGVQSDATQSPSGDVG